MKNRKTEICVIVIFLCLQTLIYLCVAFHKSYLHIDEAYSFGLANYDKIEIQDNTDFFNTWHTKNYYEDYLAVQEDEKANYTPVYENQKNDVHPPLYYLLLRFCMNFSNGHFSMWPGIILNIIIYVFITIFMYLILKKLFHTENSLNIKALILAFMSSIILASLSNVINIRMYALSTLNILITTFLHIKLLENRKINAKLLLAIGISVLAGILTHYYYLFYLIALYFIFLIKYVKEKQFKMATYYTLTLVIAGILSLIIFPYSLQHIFLGYRGQGAMSNLGNFFEIIPSIFSQLYTLNYYAFNGLLPIILLMIVILLIYNKKHKKDNFKIDEEKKKILRLLYIPTIFFFIMTSIASPWKVLRYIVPVCGLLFVLTIYYLYALLEKGVQKKIANILICILFCIILIAPFIFHLKPELLYDNRKDFVQDLNEKYNLPTIYLYDSKKGGFLDDILPFSILDESYIAKDIDVSSTSLQNIFKNKNISNGLLIFINTEQNKDVIATEVMQSLNFTTYEHLQKLSSCDVYYIH